MEIDRTVFTYRLIHPQPLRIDGEVRRRGDVFDSVQDLRGWTSAVACIGEPGDDRATLADATPAELVAAMRQRGAADRLAIACHLDDDELAHEHATRGLAMPEPAAELPLDTLIAEVAARKPPASDVLALVSDDDLVAEVRDRGRDVELALDHPEIVESVGDVLANLSPEQAQATVAHAGLKLAGDAEAEPVVEYIAADTPLDPGGNFRAFAARARALTGGVVKGRSRADIVAGLCEWIVDQSGIEADTEPSP